MTDSQRIKCHGIIHAAAGAAGAAGAGLAQIPVADAVPITAAQITMVISLGAVFDIPVSEAMAKAICRGFAAALGGKYIDSYLESDFKVWTLVLTIVAAVVALYYFIKDISK